MCHCQSERPIAEIIADFEVAPKKELGYLISEMIKTKSTQS